MAQVLSSNRNECSSFALLHGHIVGWICNSGLMCDRCISTEFLQSETAGTELRIWPCPCVYGAVVWFTSHCVTLPTNGILRKSQSDENKFCVVLEQELCQSETRNKQLIIAWHVQETELAADGAATVAVSTGREWRVARVWGQLKKRWFLGVFWTACVSNIFTQEKAERRLACSRNPYPGLHRQPLGKFLNFICASALSNSCCWSDLAHIDLVLCSWLLLWALRLEGEEGTICSCSAYCLLPKPLHVNMHLSTLPSNLRLWPLRDVAAPSEGKLIHGSN